MRQCCECISQAAEYMDRRSRPFCGNICIWLLWTHQIRQSRVARKSWNNNKQWIYWYWQHFVYRQQPHAGADKSLDISVCVSSPHTHRCEQIIFFVRFGKQADRIELVCVH